MKKLYFRMKYNWHIVKFQKLKMTLEEDSNQPSKSNLKNQINYHEKSALQCMFKF
ncbi:hypothetical protein [Aquibacillus saliphilus]|uniref:hypothetical protein n=1 Tax=Aquibacillus saliphilus TaxID=1909422 RepID=UPI001CF0CCF8|nr:hypothetical protein [Aquibacillus saliphilus]